MKYTEIKELSVDDLQSLILSMKKELSNLSLKAKVASVPFGRKRLLRRNIAMAVTKLQSFS